MTVYVDKSPPHRGRPLAAMLIADTVPELARMARILGLPASHVLNVDGFAYFELTKAQRAIAVGAGAVEVTRHEIQKRLRGAVRASTTQEASP